MKSPNPPLPARFFGAFFAVLVAVPVMSTTAPADHNTPEALEARTMPEGKLNVVAAGGTATAGAAAAGAGQDGEAVYNSGCAACHGGGIAGAPKTGDVDVWSARIAQGMAVLVEHAINGFQGETGIMIAKGGNAALSDDEVEAAVKFMVERSQ